MPIALRGDSMRKNRTKVNTWVSAGCGTNGINNTSSARAGQRRDILTLGMGSISVACYKPKAGCEDALLQLVRNHLPPLRAEGLVTDRASIIMRAGDGTIIEVFEWVSQEAIAGAHSNPAVLDLWKRFEAVCTYAIPSDVAEFTKMFAHFEPIWKAYGLA
jgi:hypothetical protein